MGNKPVRIGLRTDQTTYEAGSVLTGRVYLSISGKKHRADAVHLVLVGEEHATIVHEEQDHTSSTRRATDQTHRRAVERSTASLVHMDVPLTSQFEGGMIGPGQYEYPFEWELPTNLPGTMRCQKGESFCEITYHMKAYLYKESSGSFLSSNNEMSSAQNLCILSHAKTTQHHAQHGIVMPPEEFPIHICCARRGHVMLGWDLSSSVASPRSSVQVGIVGSNQSTTKVRYVQVCWTETISFAAHGKTEELVRTLAESKISVTSLAEWQALDRVPSRARRGLYHMMAAAGGAGSSTTYSSFTPDQQQQQQQEPQQHRLLTALSLPADARDSYRGHLLQVRHSLVVTAVTSGGCCVTSPESAAVVQVQRATRTAPVTTPTAVQVSPQEVPEEEVPPMATTVEEPTSSYVQDDEYDSYILEANVLPENWSAQTADVVTLPAQSATVLGEPSAGMGTTTADTLPTAPDESLLLDRGAKESSSVSAQQVSFEQLQQSLAAHSFDQPVQYIQDHWIQNPTIVPLLQNLTPHEYVTLIQCVSRAGDMPQVARILACVMDGSFLGKHILACLWALPPYIRMEVMREVAPLATLSESERASMEQQMDANELLHFRAALR